MSLIEVSGPFLSMPVLLRAFPQGLDAHDPELTANLRLAYEEWSDNQLALRPDPAIHRAWVRYVLRAALGFEDDLLVEGPALPPELRVEVAEHGETLLPDLAVVRATRGERARLLVSIVPVSQDLEVPLAGRRWKASPATRLAELLRGTDVPLGLVTNGERWMLVYAPRGETSGFASWYAELWFEEPLTLRAFRSLLAMRRFYGVPDNDTPEALLRESASNQQEVTIQLGDQVRQAVDVLVRTLDRIDRDRGRTLLVGLDVTVLYEAALTVMMRLVFLFSAEERGLLRLGDPLYDQSYAVSTLGTQLRVAADQGGEEVLERRHDAWSRLLATFRAVYGESATRICACRPTVASCSTPTASPCWKGACPARPGTTPRRRCLCPWTIGRCCTCWRRCRCYASRCRAAGRSRAGCLIGHWTWSRSATSTRACSTTWRGAPSSRCWA
ncbi:MAG: type IIL restriction-modification enzyme MmeI [Solirubrobacteraceae bacterium]